MTWRQLRKKCKRESDYIITLFVTNEVSLFLTWILNRTRVTPNHVTMASVSCELFCACLYASGHFMAGSLFYFLAHILDCTDGNLARAKELFSPLGRWFDLVGDRLGEVFIFLGISFYFYSSGHGLSWTFIALLDALLILLYYYIVDVGLSLGIAGPSQGLSSWKIKDVRVKWGLYEPVMYGLILLAPLGLLKLQLALILGLVLTGLVYQAQKNYRLFRSLEQTPDPCRLKASDTAPGPHDP